MKETGYFVWNRENTFNPKTISKSLTISKKERLLLLFRRPKYSYDWDSDVTTITKYKVMGGKIYVLKVERSDRSQPNPKERE